MRANLWFTLAVAFTRDCVAQQHGDAVGRRRRLGTNTIGAIGGFVDDAPNTTNSSVTFYAVGDVPYSDMEKCLLPFELDQLTTDIGRFLIHLGDVRDGKPDPTTRQPRPCPESMFENLVSIFNQSTVPTFFIPGDNGWLDCANAIEAYGYWKTQLFDFNQRLAFPAIVNRWDTFPEGVVRNTDRSAFFSFILDRVLFVGLNLPGGGRNKDNPWTPRDGLVDDNVQWTEENIGMFANEIDAIVLFGHSATYPGNNDYFVQLEGIAASVSNISILFLEDAHHFRVQESFRGISNLLLIAQDDTVTPMTVTVNPHATGGIRNVFQFDRRCICSTGHRPTGLIDYPSSHKCAGACTDAHYQCRFEDSCSPPGRIC